MTAPLPGKMLVAGQAMGWPFLIKGQNPEDAKVARDTLLGFLISNHGGRQLVYAIILRLHRPDARCSW